jgi:hypothetical protein
MLSGEIVVHAGRWFYLITDFWTEVGHPCRGIRQSMLVCRVEVGRIGALALAN